MTTLHCPICNEEVVADPKNPDKYLCKHCRMRFDSSQVVVREEQPEEDPLAGLYDIYGDIDLDSNVPQGEYSSEFGTPATPDMSFEDDNLGPDMFASSDVPDPEDNVPLPTEYGMNYPPADAPMPPMATPQDVEQPKKKKKGGKIALIVILAIIVLLAAGSALLYFLAPSTFNGIAQNIPVLNGIVATQQADEAEQQAELEAQQAVEQQAALESAKAEAIQTITSRAVKYKDLDDPWNGWFNFDGKAYYLQEITLKTFLEKTGWKLSGISLEKEIDAQQSINVLITSDNYDSDVLVTVQNQSANSNTVEELGNCVVTGISVEGLDSDKAVPFRISGNLERGISDKKLEKMYGKPETVSKDKEYAYYVNHDYNALITVHYNGDEIVGITTETKACGLEDDWYVMTNELEAYVLDPEGYIDMMVMQNTPVASASFEEEAVVDEAAPQE